MATPTQELIHNVLDTKYEDFDAVTVRNAKNQILDLAGVMVSGWKGPGNSAYLDLVRQWGGQGEATILGNGDKVPLPQAAMMNSLQCRSYDHEAVGPYPHGQNEGMFCGHVESSTLPASFSVAEYVGASGKDLIAAVVLGGDLTARIAFVEGLGFDHPFDPLGTANAFGVAALNQPFNGHDRGSNDEYLWDCYHAGRRRFPLLVGWSSDFQISRSPLGPQRYYLGFDVPKRFYRSQGSTLRYPGLF